MCKHINIAKLSYNSEKNGNKTKVNKFPTHHQFHTSVETQYRNTNTTKHNLKFLNIAN